MCTRRSSSRALMGIARRYVSVGAVALAAGLAAPVPATAQSAAPGASTLDDDIVVVAPRS